MKKNVIKMAVAAVCVVAAGMGGMNAYNANQSEADMLLSENVEALSSGDYGGYIPCKYPGLCFRPGQGTEPNELIW